LAGCVSVVLVDRFLWAFHLFVMMDPMKNSNKHVEMMAAIILSGIAANGSRIDSNSFNPKTALDSAYEIIRLNKEREKRGW
jgi:hypothetical protein